ncbi:MAG TPA: sugar transferase [Terriglobales bacterium]
MGQLVNIAGSPATKTNNAKTAHMALDPRDNVRVIPGSWQTGMGWEKKRPVLVGASNADPQATTQAGAAWLIPKVLTQFAPAMLGTAIFDVSVIALVFWAASGRAGLPISPLLLLFYLSVMLLLAVQEGVYARAREDSQPERAALVKAVLWTTLFTGLALKCASAAWSALFVLLWSCGNVFVLCGWRWVWQILRNRSEARAKRNVLVLGGAASSQGVIDALALDPATGTIEFLAEHHLREAYGAVMLQRLARQGCVDELIISTDDEDITQDAIHQARRSQLDVLVAPNLFGGRARGVESRGGVPLVKVHEQLLPEWGLALKRVLDVLCASAGLLILSLLFVTIATAIKIDSPGPVLYRSTRVGRKGRRFCCYKFRSMVVAADSEKEDLRLQNQRVGAFFKIEDDPRITRVGHFLRRYSLDELPQLWNVVVGEMSLVGPRPHPPDDVERYRVGDLRRLDVIPGITGLWQVTARRDPSFARCVALDVDYIRRWSIRLDFLILWKTLAAVLQGSGA